MPLATHSPPHDDVDDLFQEAANAIAAEGREHQEASFKQPATALSKCQIMPALERNCNWI
jgi:hypothetical protein